MIDYLLNKIISNEAMLASTFGAALVYVMLSRETLIRRFASGASGFICALIFADPIDKAFTGGEHATVWASLIALCGQFVPVLIQTTVSAIKHTDVIEAIKSFLQK